MTISTKGSKCTPDREALFNQIRLFPGSRMRELNSLKKERRNGMKRETK